MRFGINFSPSIGPTEKPAAQYWAESIDLAAAADALGYGHIRCVEHYFERYGGYSPNPIVFLAACASRTRAIRLITGALLPAFNNPLKMAGEIGMLDAISGGRAEIGFARAFLPHEFERFGVSVDDSRARFNEGIEQVRRLLEEENVSADGRFHSCSNVTSLPRPTQRPRPPFWVAAFATPQSFEDAGRAGYRIMAIPRSGKEMAELIGRYREAWRSAGHQGSGTVMLSFLMHCAPNRDAAVANARGPAEGHVEAMIECAAPWIEGKKSADYPGYGAMFQSLKKWSFDDQVAKGVIWVGNPADIREQIDEYARSVGGFDIASVPVNFHDLPYDKALASIRLFAEAVMPHFADKPRAAAE